MAVTGWSLAGQSLRTPGWEILDVDGWDTYPVWEGGDVNVANMHGRVINTRRFAGPRSISIPMIILPYDPTTGAQSSAPEVHLQQNVETLLGLLYGHHSELTIVRTMPDTSTRTITGEVRQAIPITGRGGARLLDIELECAYPFWHGAALSDLGNSGSFTVTNNGNAPIADAVFTFSTAATLTHDDTGDVFEILSGTNTVVDAGARTIQRASVDVDNDFKLGDSGYWIELLPGDNDFTLSAGTVDITGYHGWL